MIYHIICTDLPTVSIYYMSHDSDVYTKRLQRESKISYIVGDDPDLIKHEQATVGSIKMNSKNIRLMTTVGCVNHDNYWFRTLQNLSISNSQDLFVIEPSANTYDNNFYNKVMSLITKFHFYIDKYPNSKIKVFAGIKAYHALAGIGHHSFTGEISLGQYLIIPCEHLNTNRVIVYSLNDMREPGLYLTVMQDNPNRFSVDSLGNNDDYYSLSFTIS